MKLNQLRLNFLIADVARLMRKSFESELEDSTLTFAQARVLIHASRNEGLRQIELAELMEIQPITLARLIDQLEAAGLIERRADAGDRRAYRIHPTAAAEEHVLALERRAAAMRRKALHGLSKAEIDAMSQTLEAVRNNLTGR